MKFVILTILACVCMAISVILTGCGRTENNNENFVKEIVVNPVEVKPIVIR